jgi:hypothetical protein
MGEKAYSILVGKAEGKKPVGRQDVSGRMTVKCVLEK